MGLDQHRAQITYDLLDTETGEVRGGRIRPADRESVREFVQRFAGEEVEAALEATTGWRFLAEELQAAGAQVHLAEPAETSERRGPKKRAKTDRADARHLRELLQVGRLPESWIPPEDHPITHHVAGLDNEAADRDKAGRPRAPSTATATPNARPAPHTSNTTHQLGRRAWRGVPGQIRRPNDDVVDRGRAHH